MSKIIDGKGRLFGRISVIDIIVIIVALVLIVAFYIKFNAGDNPFTSRDTTEVTYTVRIASIRLTSANHLRPGDNIYYQETGAFVGTIKDVEINDAEVTDSIVDGTYVVASVEDRYDITLTIDANCTISNDRYYINNTFELRVNASYRFLTKYNDVSGIVTTITPG